MRSGHGQEALLTMLDAVRKRGQAALPAVEQLFGERAAAMVMRLAANVDSYRKGLEDLNDTEKIGERNKAADAAEAQTLHVQMQQLGEVWGDLTEKLGVMLIPALTKVLNSLKEGIGWVSEFTQAHRGLVLAIGAAAAGFAAFAAASVGLKLVKMVFVDMVGAVVQGVGMIRTAFTALTVVANLNPVILGITVGVVALGAAAFLVWKNWDKVKAFFLSLKPAIQPVIDWLMSVGAKIGAIVHGIGSAMAGVGRFFHLGGTTHAAPASAAGGAMAAGGAAATAAVATKTVNSKVERHITVNAHGVGLKEVADMISQKVQDALKSIEGQALNHSYDLR